MGTSEAVVVGKAPREVDRYRLDPAGLWPVLLQNTSLAAASGASVGLNLRWPAFGPGPDHWLCTGLGAVVACVAAAHALVHAVRWWRSFEVVRFNDACEVRSSSTSVRFELDAVLALETDGAGLLAGLWLLGARAPVAGHGACLRER